MTEKNSFWTQFKGYAVTVIAVIALLVGWSVFNTHKLTRQADKNNTAIKELVSIINSDKSADSLERAYIRTNLKEVLEAKSVEKLTEYNKMLAESASHANNTMLLWATVLMTISIMFTFLGMMDLKDRLKNVETAAEKVDTAAGKAKEATDKAEEEIANLNVKKREIESMQADVKAMQADVDNKFNLINIDTKRSQYALKFQTLLILSNVEKDQTIRNLESLAQEIQDDKTDDFTELLGRIFFRIAYIYGEKGDLNKAIENYNTAINFDPKDADSYYNRGIIHAKLKDFDNAIEDYNKAIELDQKDSNAYYNRGIIYAKLKDFDKAIENYSKAIELNPNYASAYNNRGDTYMQLKDFDKAVEDCSEAINIDPKNVYAYYTRAEAYQNKGENAKNQDARAEYYRLAIIDFEQVITLSKNDEMSKEAQEMIDKIEGEMGESD